MAIKSTNLSHISMSDREKLLVSEYCDLFFDDEEKQVFQSLNDQEKILIFHGQLDKFRNYLTGQKDIQSVNLVIAARLSAKAAEKAAKASTSKKAGK